MSVGRCLATLGAALLSAVLVACGSDSPIPPSPGAAPPPGVSGLLKASPAPSPTPQAAPSPSPTGTVPGADTPLDTPPPLAKPAQVIRQGKTDRRAVALTFDAGSDAGYAGDILDTLAANGIAAAFGITGRWAEATPELLERIVAEGHQLINHSYDHPSFTGGSTGRAALAREERWDQLDRTEAIVQRLTGASTEPYFRPPFGDYDDSVGSDVAARGYTYIVMWTVDSFGWKGITAEEIRQRCLDLAQPGAIYVFHLGSASQDGPALEGVIEGIRQAGYEIVSLPELLGAP